MINSPSQHTQGVQSLFHTGIFLRPRIARSLQALIRNRAIQDRAQFTIAKSQIHPNGLCEIVVKRQDPTVPTNAIIELLERCRKLVEEHILPKDKSLNADLNRTIDVSNADLNRTIDVSDNDDSICIVSPSHSGGRMISSKRSLSINSPSNVNVSPINQAAMEPLPKRQNLIINVNSQPSSSNQDRKVVLQSKDCVNAQLVPKQSSSGSPLTSRKGENIVIKVLNNNKPSSSPQCDDADSSVILLDVIEDPKPAAPTWTTSQDSSFPLNSISQNFGKNLAMDVLGSQVSSFPLNSISQNLGKNLARDVPTNSSENQSSSKTVQEKTIIGTHICSPGIDLVRRFSDVVKENCKPKGFTSAEPVESLDKSKDQLVSGLIIGSSSGLTNPSQREEERQSGDLMKTSSDSQRVIEPKLKGRELVQLTKEAHHTAKTSPSDVFMVNVASNQSGKETNCQIGEKGSGRASSSASGERSYDDEIIIEKVLKSTKIPSLIVEDSDDDIAVCEVVNTRVVNVPMLSKHQKRKQSMINCQKQPGTSVASTSSGPALDYIPLFNTSHQRKRQNTPNQTLNLSKASKFQKIYDKKDRKARAKALQFHSIQSGKVDSSSEQKQSSENKEKREFGANIINPNPENSKTGLRPVVIDASNVAIAHGRALGGHTTFSVRGLKICIKYFTDRGHKVIALAPKFRRFHVSPEERKALDELETQGILSFTPSRTMEDGRKVASYDDRYIVQVAAELGGVVISTDNYRDLLSENEAWRETIEQRLLMFTWVGDMLLFPNDPLGRSGPHLQDFLRFPDSSSSSSSSSSTK